jgi:hypothetical protein
MDTKATCDEEMISAVLYAMKWRRLPLKNKAWIPEQRAPHLESSSSRKPAVLFGSVLVCAVLWSVGDQTNEQMIE